MKRFLLRIQTYLRKLAGIPVPDEMPMPQSDIEKSLYEICKNNPNGIRPGIEPAGSISITENGTYDVAEFAEAAVEVEGSAVEHHQFVHAENWLSDSVGNTHAFYNTYLDPLYKDKSSGFGITIITNNTATQHPASYSFRNFRFTNRTAWFRNNFSTNTGDVGEPSASFYISAGSHIDIYIFPE